MRTLYKTISGRGFTLREDGKVYSHPFIDSIGRARKGMLLAECSLSHGYLVSNAMVGGKHHQFLSHRVAWEAYHGVEIEEGMHIDHKDGNGRNNSIENLRIGTCKLNCRSFRAASKVAASKYRGVFKADAGHWRARIRKGDKSISGGTYATEIEAAVAYDLLALEVGFREEALNRYQHKEVALAHGEAPPTRRTNNTLGGASKFCGVSTADGVRFRARAYWKGGKSLGVFLNEIEAALTYDAAAEKAGRPFDSFNRSNHQCVMDAYLAIEKKCGQMDSFNGSDIGIDLQI